MKWESEAYILSARKHGETSAIVHVLTPDQGRHAGLVHGAVGRRLRPVLQPGNKVRATWQARLSEHLGTMTVEAIDANAAHLMQERLSLAGLNALCAMCQAVLPEREARADVYAAFEVVIKNLHLPQVWPALFVKWEQGVLAGLGYGLDLSSCVASGSNDNLTHISPRSGRAVSASEAEPYLDKLFKLPPFMLGQSHITQGDALLGLGITGHFLERRALWPVNKTLPEARSVMVEKLKSLEQSGQSL